MKKNGVVTKVLHRPIAFALAFLALFALTFAFLALVGAVPDSSGTDNTLPQSVGPTTATLTAENPTRIVAPSISLDTTVENPVSTDLTVLDDALTKGAVHFPTSAPLGVDGTVLIFGHSSYLPVVYHQYYKTFDGIQTLKPGATVSVYSGTTEYRYSVTGVKVASASDVIATPTTGKHLTLVTCDSFSDKSSRFVVTADFVGAYKLAP